MQALAIAFSKRYNENLKMLNNQTRIKKEGKNLGYLIINLRSAKIKNPINFNFIGFIRLLKKGTDLDWVTQLY